MECTNFYWRYSRSSECFAWPRRRESVLCGIAFSGDPALLQKEGKPLRTVQSAVVRASEKLGTRSARPKTQRDCNAMAKTVPSGLSWGGLQEPTKQSVKDIVILPVTYGFIMFYICICMVHMYDTYACRYSIHKNGKNYKYYIDMQHAMFFNVLK